MSHYGFHGENVFFIFFLLNCILFCGGGCKAKGWIQRDGELSGIKMSKTERQRISKNKVKRNSGHVISESIQSGNTDKYRYRE